MYRHMRPCVLSLATFLFLLILMHVFPTYIVIFSLSLPQSLPFLFSHLSEPFFSSVPHFQLLTLVIRLGITCLNKCRPPSLVECSLSAAQSPELHARSQTCLCGKRYFFPFIGATLDWTQRQKLHLHTPEVHVWYFIVTEYVFKVCFTICLCVTH